jgi:hypothetical protein
MIKLAFDQICACSAPPMSSVISSAAVRHQPSRKIKRRHFITLKGIGRRPPERIIGREAMTASSKSSINHSPEFQRLLEMSDTEFRWACEANYAGPIIDAEPEFIFAQYRVLERQYYEEMRRLGNDVEAYQNRKQMDEDPLIGLLGEVGVEKISIMRTVTEPDASQPNGEIA